MVGAKQKSFDALQSEQEKLKAAERKAAETNAKATTLESQIEGEKRKYTDLAEEAQKTFDDLQSGQAQLSNKQLLVLACVSTAPATTLSMGSSLWVTLIRRTGPLP